jgi:hypothetical protein
MATAVLHSALARAQDESYRNRYIIAITVTLGAVLLLFMKWRRGAAPGTAAAH